MLHVDPAWLRRNPIAGVLFGFVTAGFLAYLIHSGWDEVRALRQQDAPEVMSVSEAARRGSIRWITLSDGEWHCAEAVRLENTGLAERLLWGRIDSVEVPITGATTSEFVVARFGGEIDCPERSRGGLSGVINSREVFTSRATEDRWARPGLRSVILQADCSPRQANLLLLGVGAIFLLGVGFAGYYLRLLVGGDRLPPPHPPGHAPIDPT